MDTTSTTRTATAAIPSNASRSFWKYVSRSVLLWLAFLPLAFVVIVPLVYETVMAFTTEENQLVYPIVWFPNPITISNFSHIFADTTLPIIRWFGNSLLVAIVGTALIVFLS